MPAVPTLGGPLVWAADLAKTPEKFTLVLDEQACDEVKTALATFKGKFWCIPCSTSPETRLMQCCPLNSQGTWLRSHYRGDFPSPEAQGPSH